MAGFSVNKIAGAVIMTGLLLMVISMLGNNLVAPKEHTAAVVAGAEKAAPAAKKAKAAIPLEPIGPLLASADLAKGEGVAKKCVACHTLTDGGKDKVGPNLWNIVNANKARVDGFGYSSGMKEKGGTWSYEDLNKFLAKPKAYIAKTKMAFAGLKKTSDRAAIIAYLRSLSAAPAPLP